MEVPDFATDFATAAWLEEQDQLRLAHDRSYRFANDVGIATEELSSRSTFQDAEAGPLDVYILKDLRNKPMAYLGVTRFDEDDPHFDDPNQDELDWDDAPLLPEHTILARVQSFPFGKVPKSHKLHWQVDQHRDGSLVVSLFRDGAKFTDIDRREDSLQEALRVIENFTV